jgi:glycosyltransferase involved in cell wall biosynthesis
MLMTYWIQRYATHILTCSSAALGNILPSMRRGDKRAELLKNGVCTSMFADLPSASQLRARLGLSPDNVLVGHVGSFSPVKNHAFTIAVFEELLHYVPTCQLILVGDGGDRAAISQMATERGIAGKVHFLGIRRDVPEILGALDLFVFPSLHEGLPFALIEAQAAGVFSLISDRVTREVDLSLGLAEFLPIDRGAAVWRDAILRALTANRPPWAQRASALARSGYDLSASIRRLTEIYEESFPERAN